MNWIGKLVDRFSPYRVTFCEKCGSQVNIATHKIFNIYETILCNPCKREWEQFIITNPDWKALTATSRLFEASEDLVTRNELRFLAEDITKELKPILDTWLKNDTFQNDTRNPDGEISG